MGYGETLGSILFYDGDSYHIPWDDAPRAAAVFNRAGGPFLIVGTGRPREIRVIYPWKGEEILCRGAILPFHAEMAATHLTDREWQAHLDSARPPVAPDWLKPLHSPDAPARNPGE